MFLHVCHSVHGCLGGGMHGCSGGGVCGCLGGHAWLLRGCVCGCSWGVCMVALEGGMHGCSGGCAWLLLGGACMRYDEIWRYDQWAGGTHPTGMHSCFGIIFEMSPLLHCDRPLPFACYSEQLLLFSFLYLSKARLTSSKKLLDKI